MSSPIEPLITAAYAKAHLRLDCDESELHPAIDRATAIVMRHMKLDEWSEDWILDDTSPAVCEVPADIQARTLEVLGALWADREGADGLVKKVLDSWWDRRTPTMA